MPYGINGIHGSQLFNIVKIVRFKVKIPTIAKQTGMLVMRPACNQGDVFRIAVFISADIQPAYQERHARFILVGINTINVNPAKAIIVIRQLAIHHAILFLLAHFVSSLP